MNKFKFWCQNVLPLTFDDSISYYECLCKVRDVLNSIIDALNNLQNEWEKYTDQEITKLAKRVDDYIAQVEELIDQTMAKIDALSTNVDKKLLEQDKKNDIKIQELEKKNDLLREWVVREIEIQENNLHIVESELLMKINEMGRQAFRYTDDVYEMERDDRKISESELQAQIDELRKLLPYGDIYNPTSGYNESVAKTMIDVYNACRDRVCTARQFDQMHLTANQIDKMKRSALWWDTRSLNKWFEIYFNTTDYMYSPVTGKRVSVAQALIDVWQKININAKTADEYDALKLTADQFDSSDYNAYEQDTSNWWTSDGQQYKNRLQYTEREIWKNTDPSLSMGIMDISCDMTGYDAIRFVFLPDRQYTTEISVIVNQTDINQNNYFMASYTDSASEAERMTYLRYIQLYDDHFHVHNGYTYVFNQQATESTLYMIPVACYGIKYIKPLN